MNKIQSFKQSKIRPYMYLHGVYCKSRESKEIAYNYMLRMRGVCVEDENTVIMNNIDVFHFVVEGIEPERKFFYKYVMVEEGISYEYYINEIIPHFLYYNENAPRDSLTFIQQYRVTARNELYMVCANEALILESYQNE